MEKQPSHTFEIGYIENGKPFKLDTVAVEQYEVWVEGGDQKNIFRILKIYLVIELFLIIK